MPVYNPLHPRTSPPSFLAPRLATLCLWLPIQRQRSRLCQDQELEFLCPWRSKEERSVYPNLTFRADRFPQRFGSPFIEKGALKGPGGIGDCLVEKTVADTGGKADINRKRSRRNTYLENEHSKGLYIGPGAQTGASTPTAQQSAYPYPYQL